MFCKPILVDRFDIIRPRFDGEGGDKFDLYPLFSSTQLLSSGSGIYIIITNKRIDNTRTRFTRYFYETVLHPYDGFDLHVLRIRFLLNFWWCFFFFF